MIRAGELLNRPIDAQQNLFVHRSAIASLARTLDSVLAENRFVHLGQTLTAAGSFSVLSMIERPSSAARQIAARRWVARAAVLMANPRHWPSVFQWWPVGESDDASALRVVLSLSALGQLSGWSQRSVNGLLWAAVACAVERSFSVTEDPEIDLSATLSLLNKLGPVPRVVFDSLSGLSHPDVQKMGSSSPAAFLKSFWVLENSGILLRPTPEWASAADDCLRANHFSLSMTKQITSGFREIEALAASTLECTSLDRLQSGSYSVVGGFP